MVSAVHGRAHKVRHAGVQADVIFIGLLFVDGGGHQIAVGTGDAAAQLHGQGQPREPGGDDDFLVGRLYSGGDAFHVHSVLLRPVGDADAAPRFTNSSLMSSFSFISAARLNMRRAVLMKDCS